MGITLRFVVDEQQYEIDVTRILNTEAIAVQKVTGYGYDDWLSKCDDGDPMAVTAMVWIAMKRANPELRYSDVSFPMRETWGNREYVTDADLTDDGEGDDATPTQPAEAGQTESN